VEYAGWRLIDVLAGYGAAVIVDSIRGGPGDLGDCYRVSSSSKKPLHLQTSHGLGFEDAIELAVMSGVPMPERIAVYAVEAKNVDDFGERLSPEVEKRVPAIVTQIMEDIRCSWA
jgi:hydrogenase maturation protease